MREATIVKKILAGLKARGYWAVKLHGSAFQKGLPDILAIKNGRAFFFEVKSPGGKATALQAAMLTALAKAGAVAAVVCSWEEVERLLSDTRA